MKARRAGFSILHPPSSKTLRPFDGLRAGLCASAVRREVAILACFAAAWGLLYGLIMNLWFWPFVSGLSAQSWQPGLGLAAAVQHYVAFYLATSLVWDLLGAAGNLALIVAVGAPTLQALRRFRRRFAFDYHP